MEQFNNASVTATILEFLSDTVFANVEQDKLLQKALKLDKTLTPLDQQSIADTYSQKTTSIINTDKEFRDVFWKEFFSWVYTEKTLAQDPVILARRLLPVNPEGGFFDEAYRNFNKFSFQTIKSFEFYLIEKKIEEKYGKDSDEAKAEKAKLKNGDLTLIRGKDGKFDYYQNEDVRRALESVQKTAEFFKNLKQVDENNGFYAISFNPIQDKVEGKPEVKSSVLDLNKQIWSNKAALMQKHLEMTIGLHVEGPLKVDNGVAKGNVVNLVLDEKTNRYTPVKLRLEVSVVKPGKKVYKFTFADRPTQNFTLTEDQLHDNFVNKKRNVLEVYKMVQAAREKKRGTLPVAAAVKKPKGRAKPGERVETEEKKKGSEPVKGQLASGAKVEPPAKRLKEVEIDQTRKLQGGQSGTYVEARALEPPIKGPIPAKKEYETRFNKEREVLKNGRFVPQGDALAQAGDKDVGNKGKNNKNAVLQVMKWYGVAGAGLGGAIGGITLFT